MTGAGVTGAGVKGPGVKGPGVKGKAMRATVALMATAAMPGVLGLAACGRAEKKAAAADAKAAGAGFVPPSVTSRLDYGGQQERRFHRLDRNGDDVLTRAEVPRPDSPILSFDRDGSGDVSLNEFTEGTMARFDRMDLNRDGTVTSEERRTSGGGR